MRKINLIPENFNFDKKLNSAQKDIQLLKFLIAGRTFANEFSKIPDSYFQHDIDALVSTPEFKIKKYDIVSKEYEMIALYSARSIEKLQTLHFCEFYNNYKILTLYFNILDKNRKKFSILIPSEKVLNKVFSHLEKIARIEKDILTICEYKNLQKSFEEITRDGNISFLKHEKFINSIIS